MVDFEAKLADAYARGYEDGRVTEARRVDTELLRISAAVGAVTDALATAHAEALAAATTDIGSLVERFCRRIVGAHLTYDGAAVTLIALNAVGQLPEAAKVTIHVSPALAPAIRRAITSRPNLEVIEDGHIDGGCRVSTSLVSIDSTLEVIDNEIDKAFRELRGDWP